MLSVGRCDVVRLQMKFGHMDGMHCIIDSTSILVKIKSVALYNCRTLYVNSQILKHVKTELVPINGPRGENILRSLNLTSHVKAISYV